MSGEKKSSRSPYLLISAIVFIALGIAVIVFKSTIVEEINDIIKWVAVGILGVIAIVNILSFVKNTKENIRHTKLYAYVLSAFSCSFRLAPCVRLCYKGSRRYCKIADTAASGELARDG